MPPPGWGPPPPLPKAGSKRSGPLPLHPMTFADVLDGAFKLLRADFRAIMLAAAVLLVPVNIVIAFLQRDTLGGYGILELMSDPSLAEEVSGPSSASSQVTTVLTVLALVVVTPLVGAAVTRVVAATYLGEQIGAGTAWRATLARLVPLLVALLAGLLLKFVGVFLCVVGALVAMTFFLVTTPAIMVERLGPIRGMARSAELVRRRFWPVLGIGIVSGLMATVLSNIIAFPFTLVALGIGLEWGWILLALGSIIPELVTVPFVSIVATLVYFDARIRWEGLDLQMMASGLRRG